MNKLISYGWQAFFENQRQTFDDTLIPARVIKEDKGRYLLVTEEGEIHARIAGRLRHHAQSNSELPTVGDWVLYPEPKREERPTIQHVLPRQNQLARKIAGKQTEAQLLAANVDYAFIVSGLDHDFNAHRIQRFLICAENGNVTPVVLLNKCDLCDDPQPYVDAVLELDPALDVHVISVTENIGLDVLEDYFARNQTVVLLGSSGVGKSALTNYLIGEDLQQTGAVREDDSHGRHTTRARHLMPLKDKGIIIDTPGIRELQLWATEDDLDRSFSEIAELATQCKFNDCTHTNEPGCAVLAALADGTLSQDTYDHYKKLQAETVHLDRRKTHLERKNAKQFTKMVNQHVRSKKRK